MRRLVAVLAGLVAASAAADDPKKMVKEPIAKAQGSASAVDAAAVETLLKQIKEGKNFMVVPMQPYGATTPARQDGMYLMVPAMTPGNSLTSAINYYPPNDYAKLMEAQTRAIQQLSDQLKAMDDRLKALEKGKP